jgi:hypothetical protein
VGLARQKVGKHDVDLLTHVGESVTANIAKEIAAALREMRENRKNDYGGNQDTVQ